MALHFRDQVFKKCSGAGHSAEEYVGAHVAGCYHRAFAIAVASMHLVFLHRWLTNVEVQVSAARRQRLLSSVSRSQCSLSPAVS